MNFIIKKVSYLILVLFLSMSFVFLGLRLTPGDPVERILGEQASIEEVQEYREKLGLDKSLSSQFVSFWSETLKGKLGTSLFKRKKVADLIKKAMVPSLIIAFFAIFLSFVTGSFLGVICALRRERSLDKSLRVISLVGLSLPVFSSAPFLVLIFSIYLGWLPVSEWGDWRHVLLPVLTLAIPLGAVMLKVSRNRFLEENSSEWAQVLRAKGMSQNSIVWRVFYASLPTLLNILALQLSVVLAGTLVTESIFDIPGLGGLLFEAIQNRDYPLIQGCILYAGFIYLCVYWLVDVLNAKIDPRLERSSL